jgi:hypothetical protein
MVSYIMDGDWYASAPGGAFREAGSLSRDPGYGGFAEGGADFCAAAGVLGLLGKGLVICRSWKKSKKLGEKSWASGRRSDLPIRRFITQRRL